MMGQEERKSSRVGMRRKDEEMRREEVKER